MKTIGLRSLYSVAPFITEPVLVLHDRRIIGTYTPVSGAGELTGVLDMGPNVTEATVDEIRKAIEPDKVRESRGRLTKGLGDVPGLQNENTTFPVKEYQEFRPAPKPSTTRPDPGRKSK